MYTLTKIWHNYIINKRLQVVLSNKKVRQYVKINKHDGKVEGKIHSKSDFKTK